jgi:superfamily I DNA/RNA helicase
VVSESEIPDYDGTCEVAGQLLASPDVKRWIAARYPVIILDEFQDCAPVRLVLAQRLYEHVVMLVAADDFQNLNLTTESPGVAWLRSLNVCEELTVNRRTNNAHLIAAAQALRAGAPLIAGAHASFKILGVQSAPQAASYISQTLAPASGKDYIVLSAVKSGTAPWVDKVIELVRTKQYKQNVGPVALDWEIHADSLAESLIGSLGVAEGNAQINGTAIRALPRSVVAIHLNRWVEHQRRVLGRAEFGADEIRTQVRRAVQRARCFGSLTPNGRQIMTIHQAKNREFGAVILLWPFHVPGEAMVARRWLYNAITRAKRRAIIFVHDPLNKRLNAPPFA